MVHTMTPMGGISERAAPNEPGKGTEAVAHPANGANRATQRVLGKSRKISATFPLLNVDITMENHIFLWENSLNSMSMFNRYVPLPEGIGYRMIDSFCNRLLYLGTPNFLAGGGYTIHAAEPMENP